MAAGIRTSPGQDALDSVVQGALGAIPYAGGLLSSVVANFANHKRNAKIAEAIEFLGDAVKKVDAKVEAILDEDQVVEVLQDGLSSIASSADEEKIAFLKTGMARAFTDPTMKYPRKQHYLSMLRGLSSLELSVLRAFYLEGDPYEVHDFVAPPRATSGVANIVATANFAVSSLVVAPWGWRFKEWRSDDRVGPLLKVISGTCREDPVVVRSAIGRLDQFGLLEAASHLEERQYKLMEPAAAAGSITATFTSAVTLSSMSANQRSPVEASRSEAGLAFIEFCTHATPA